MRKCIMNFVVPNAVFFRVSQNIKGQGQLNAAAVDWNWRFVFPDGPFILEVMHFWGALVTPAACFEL